LEDIQVSLDIEKCIEITNDLSELFDAKTSSDELETPTMAGLRFLWDQSNVLFDLVKARDESQGRSGKDYFDGVKLGELAYLIAQKLKSRNLLNPQEIALRIRLKALLQVQAYYHHIIGPAMLEHSQLLERLDRIDEAIDNYECIISDFSWTLNEYDSNEKIELDEDLISVQSLNSAIKFRLRHGLSKIEKEELEKKLSKTEELLSNS
jgi:hypothetical protein